MKEEHDFDHQQEEDNLNPLHESDYPQQDESYSPQEALVTEEITD